MTEKVDFSARDKSQTLDWITRELHVGECTISVARAKMTRKRTKLCPVVPQGLSNEVTRQGLYVGRCKGSSYEGRTAPSED